MECTVTSQLDYIMNIIITLCASWHALDCACCLQQLTERLRKKKTKNDRHRRTAACSPPSCLLASPVFANNWLFCNLIGDNRFSVIPMMLSSLSRFTRGCGYARLATWHGGRFSTSRFCTRDKPTNTHVRKHVLRKIEDEEEISLETCRIDV